MRLLHTSDWHLGRLFHQVSLLEDQAWVLERLFELLRDERPDALVVAGDLYDRAVPPREAVVLLDEFLARLRLDLRLPVIAIAGNHDSPERIAFASRLLEREKVHLRGGPQQLAAPVVLADAHGEVAVYPVPFIEPDAVRIEWQDEAIRGHEAANRAALARVLDHRRERGGRAVLVAHAYVTGGDPSESERPLAVGGSDVVPAEVFAGFDYVALGHLHRPQDVTMAPDAGRARYSGSLLKYSFSEADHRKGVTLVELGPDGAATTRHIALGARRDVARIEGTMEQLLSDPALEARRGCFIEATLLDTGHVVDAALKLRQRFPHLASLRRAWLESPAAAPGSVARQVREATDDLALFRAFVAEVRPEAAPSAPELALFARAVDSVLAAPAAATEAEP